MDSRRDSYCDQLPQLYILYFEKIFSLFSIIDLNKKIDSNDKRLHDAVKGEETMNKISN